MESIQNCVRRSAVKLVRDDRPVIATAFAFGSRDRGRVERLLDRIGRLSEEQAQRELDRVMASFGGRHRDLPGTFDSNFAAVTAGMEMARLSQARQRLIGAYFTSEYSFESAALFNPSMVPHPDQAGVPAGEARFLMSLRAVGEGHVSSILFRTGTVGGDGSVRLDPPGRYSQMARLAPGQRYDKALFELKLHAQALNGGVVRSVLESLGAEFTLIQLEAALAKAEACGLERSAFAEAAEAMLGLAKSNYQLELPAGGDIGEAVIFPRSANECRGLEDVRLVRFVEEDGSAVYYGTYTAYNGFRIWPQLLETRDFRRVAVHTLGGRCAQNKGMALFPRRIGGRYVTCGRIDGENLFILRSDSVYVWDDAEPLDFDRQPWEFVQVGNCGSPIETPEGWLLLTHGVGPMREYSIGAMLLDLDDPRKVRGCLREPLLAPNEEERNGYVPNVVYSCGAMLQGDWLVMPYGVSDCASSFAAVPMAELLKRMK